MDLTVNTIADILKGSRADFIFLLMNETAEEVVDILIDNGIEFGNEEDRQTEASIINVLDKEEVVMISSICGEIYVESAYGHTDLKEYEQDEEWNLFIEEELILDELVDLATVYNRLGDADNINVFGLYLTEPDYSNDEFEDMEECTCCECCGKCEEKYDPVAEYLDEVVEEALEDILMMEYSCPDCIQEIIENAVEEAFLLGTQEGMLSVRNSINEHLGE